MAEKYYLVLDIGGTKVAGGISDGKQVFHRMQIPANAQDGAEILIQRITDLCKTLLQKAQSDDYPVQAVGIGTAGLVDAIQGHALDAIENLPGWQQIRIADRLGTALDRPVFVDNDVNVLALGEWLHGVGNQYKHVFYIAVGTGIGGALIENGKISHGTHYSRGEVGYLVAGMQNGNVMTLEEQAAGPVMTAQYRDQSGDETVTSLREVATRAQNGDALAQQIITDGATLAGEIIGRFLGALDTEALIVSGGVSNIGDLWWQPFIAALARNPLQSIRELPVHHVATGVEAALNGAAAMAMQHMSQ
ncbi:MAG: ROK family protein [Aggregatilineales bacterium]